MIKTRKRLRQVLNLSNKLHLEEDASVGDLAQLERAFRDLVRCSCIEAEAMSFCKNFAWDKKGADPICLHLLKNYYRLIGDSDRAVLWMKAIEDVQPWMERYLAHLLQEREYERASMLCAWYTAIFPDSKVFRNALESITAHSEKTT